MGRYATGGNLANLVNPEGVNQPKSQWEEIPWSIATGPGTPAIQSIDVSGKLSAPMTIAKAEIGGATPAPGFSLGGKVDTGATPAPAWIDFPGTVEGLRGMAFGQCNCE